MHHLALLALLLPAAALAKSLSPCSFTVGHGSVKAESTAQPQKLVPYWFTVSGRAEVELQGTTLKAKLFDTAANGDHTHSLSATLSAPVTKVPFRTNVRGNLKNLFSDAGTDALSGSLEVTTDPQSQGRPTLHSLVLHNAYSFVALSCYGASAA